MNNSNNSKVQKLLEWWLDIATKDLAVSSKERIASEIELHYAEAIGAHLAQGESEDDAQTAALSDLGEPSEAAKRFRRSHLTEAEAKYLVMLRNKAPKVSTLFSEGLWPVIVLLPALLGKFPKQHTFFYGFLFLMIICPIFSFMVSMVSRRNAIKTRIWLLLLLHGINETAFGFALLLFLTSLIGFFGVFGGFGVLYILGRFRIFPLVQIWKKTRKMTDEFDETTGIAS